MCLFVSRDHIFGTTRSIFTKLFAHVTYGRGSVLFWRRSDTLYVFPVLWMTSYLHTLAEAARRRRQAEAVRLTRTQPWAWRVGIPVAGSGRSGLLLAVRAYQAAGNSLGGNTGSGVCGQGRQKGCKLTC